MNYTSIYQSPIGKINLLSDGKFLTGLWIEGQTNLLKEIKEYEKNENIEVLCNTKKWLDDYFSGKEPKIDLKLKLNGTEFRKEVWNILLEIPYGKTMTYGEIARKIAQKRKINKMSAQAIGGAVGHNPIAIIVPCHRVIGSDGSLTGYAGGIHLKEKLLNIENSLTKIKK